MVLELPNYSSINEYTINLEKGKILSYKSIYNLGLVELENFKNYIKTNLVNSFIQLFKSSAKALILFTKMLNSSFCLYVNCKGLNNLPIKNWYLQSLIDKLLN